MNVEATLERGMSVERTAIPPLCSTDLLDALERTLGQLKWIEGAILDEGNDDLGHSHLVATSQGLVRRMIDDRTRQASNAKLSHTAPTTT